MAKLLKILANLQIFITNYHIFLYKHAIQSHYLIPIHRFGHMRTRIFKVYDNHDYAT